MDEFTDFHGHGWYEICNNGFRDMGYPKDDRANGDDVEGSAHNSPKAAHDRDHPKGCPHETQIQSKVYNFHFSPQSPTVLDE